MMKRVTTEPPANPRSLNPDANHDLAAICLKCLEKNPKDRYPTAEALAEDLERSYRGEPVSVRPPGLREWAMREVAKTPQPFPGYVWQVKVWFALIIVASQLAVFGFAMAEAPAWTVWASFLAAWSLAGAALWTTMAAKFTRLPTTEQHSVMIALGHIVCQMSIAVALLPWKGSAADSLAIYPAMFAIGGLAYFVVGTTHWGLFYLFGLVVTCGIFPAVVFPFAAPLLYGGTMAGCMVYWAWAVKVKFAGEPAEEAAEPLPTLVGPRPTGERIDQRNII
jgi:eukaryotic-like serine/threonine-protein kinase